MKQILILAGATFLVSCGNSSKGQAEEVRAPKEDQIYLEQIVEPTKYQADIERIEKFLHQVPDCKDSPNNEACSYVSLNDVDVKKPSTSTERILLIDDAFYSSYEVYAHRIEGRYEIGNDGAYQPFSNQIKMPKFLHDLWHSVMVEEFKFVPPIVRESLSSLYQKKLVASGYQWTVPLEHGRSLLQTLAELNPDAGIVVANWNSQLFKESICRKDYEQLKEHVSASAESIKTIIRQHEIHWVNLSRGDTSQIIEELVTLECKDIKFQLEERLLILEIVSEFYKEISSISGVMVAQAALSNRADVDPSDRNFSIDCVTENYPNRVRVGPVSTAGVSIPAAGLPFVKNEDLIPAGYRQASKCIDILVNSGFSLNGIDAVPGPNPLKTSLDGIGAVIVPVFQSSSAAPLGLSYLLHTKKSLFGDLPLTNEMITEIKETINSEGGVIYDPLRNKQLEVHRLNYLR